MSELRKSVSMTKDSTRADWLALSTASAAAGRAQIAAHRADMGRLLFLDRDRACSVCDTPLNPGDETLCEGCEFRASGVPGEDEREDFSEIVFRCCCPTCQTGVDDIKSSTSKELTLVSGDQTA